MNEGLRVAVGIGDPDTVPGQTEAVFESADSDGRLVIPVEKLIKVLHDSSSDWRKKSLLIQAYDGQPDTLLAADDRIELNKQKRMVTVDGHLVEDLTTYEFDLLQFLMSSLDKVSQRPEIYQAVWGHQFKRGDRTVDVYINKLRNKIGGVDEELGDRNHGAIRSRFGVGYYVVSLLRRNSD
jgi:hypothetical protein